MGDRSPYQGYIENFLFNDLGIRRPGENENLPRMNRNDRNVEVNRHLNGQPHGQPGILRRNIPIYGQGNYVDTPLHGRQRGRLAFRANAAAVRHLRGRSRGLFDAPETSPPNFPRTPSPRRIANPRRIASPRRSPSRRRPPSSEDDFFDAQTTASSDDNFFDARSA